MAEKVDFNGPKKLIIVKDGETEIDAQTDVYSAWKRWMLQPPSAAPSAGWNSGHPQAMRTVGGDDITATQVVSPYFFLTNGWRLRPYEGDHQLIVNGNLFVDGGGNPFIPTVGNHNVLINLTTSSRSITTTIPVSTGSGLSQEQDEQLFSLPNEEVIANQVWDELLSQHTSAGTAGQVIDQIKKLVSLIPSVV